MMTRVGIYPGSFDPLTLGHLDIIERSLHVVDELIIAVSNNDKKNHQMVMKMERILLNVSIPSETNPDTIEKFDHLLVDYAKSKIPISLLEA